MRHQTYDRLCLLAGAPLFEEGTLGTAAYLIEAGEVEIYVTRDGRDMSLARRGAGELIGEVAVIDRGPRSASARAATADCRVIVIDAEKLEGRSGNTDPVLQMCLGVVVMRYRHAMAQLQAVTDLLPARDTDHGTMPLPAMATIPDSAGFTSAMETLRQEHDLGRGLREGEFVLFFQPIVRLSTGRLAGFEALMRWRHPQRGLVPPGSFIPLAEAGGLIVDLTRWALDQIGQVLPMVLAAEQENPDGTERLFLTVNVSAVDLLQPAFSQTVCDMLQHAGVEASRLKVEVTESMIMTDVTRATAALRIFEQAGIGVAIDDFGTGYSSLGSLATLPISTLKVDRSFVQAMLADPVQHRIVSTILRLATELGVSVVAEGIELETEGAALLRMGCDYGQGYHFGRPMPQESMIQSIVSWNKSWAMGNLDAGSAAPSPIAAISSTGEPVI